LGFEANDRQEERRRGEDAEKQDSPPVEHVFVKISSTTPMWHPPLPPKKTPVFSPWIKGVEPSRAE
jgi:hypothetical protein